MARYWLDTEFIEDRKTIDLISIGLVCDDGREYYACNDECDLSKANAWVKKNVLIHLPSKYCGVNPSDPSVSLSVKQEILTWKTRDKIASEIVEFVYGTDERPTIEGYLDTKPEFWGYYCDYDWVVFCQLFGTMIDLPKGFPMYCRDIKQECDRLGNPKLPEQGKGEHHALSDARWNKLAWKFLNDIATSI